MLNMILVKKNWFWPTQSYLYFKYLSTI